MRRLKSYNFGLEIQAKSKSEAWDKFDEIITNHYRTNPTLDGLFECVDTGFINEEDK